MDELEKKYEEVKALVEAEVKKVQDVLTGDVEKIKADIDALIAR